MDPTLFLLYINDLPDDVVWDIAMLMILLSFITVIKHLICDSIFNWLVNLNLICKTQWCGIRTGLIELTSSMLDEEKEKEEKGVRH